MPRFFIFDDLKIDEPFTLTGKEAHHIIKVLRHKPGDTIKISDGKDMESIAVIETTDPKTSQIKLMVLEKNKKEDKNPSITLLQGLPKRDKFETILQKNTEIGVTRFVPVITSRTVVELSPKKIQRRYERWQKIVIEASKQCMGMKVPKIDDVLSFEESLDEIEKHHLTLIPWENEKEASLKQVLKGIDKSITKIAVYIGPEGGFSEEEVIKARQRGAVSVSLGSRILRTETAGVVTSSAILYELGDLGGLLCRK